MNFFIFIPTVCSSTKIDFETISAKIGQKFLSTYNTETGNKAGGNTEENNSEVNTEKATAKTETKVSNDVVDGTEVEQGANNTSKNTLKGASNENTNTDLTKIDIGKTFSFVGKKYLDKVSTEKGVDEVIEEISEPSDNETVIAQNEYHKGDENFTRVYSAYATSKAVKGNNIEVNGKTVSVENFTEEFNRIYDIGSDEETPSYEISSDIFTEEQIREIYASGIADESRDSVNPISFAEALQEEIEQAKAGQFSKNITDKSLNITKAKLKEVAEKFGLKVEFTDSLSNPNAKAEIDKKTGEIRILNSSENKLQLLFLHELTHWLEKAEGYSQFEKDIFSSKTFKKWLKTPTEAKVWQTYETVEEYQKEKRKTYPGKDIGYINQEIIATFVSENLFQGSKGIENLIGESTGAKRQRIKNFLKKIIQHLRELFGSVGKLEKEAKTLLKQIDDGKISQEKNTVTGVKSYIADVVGGKSAVVIEEDILDGVAKKDWIKTVKETISNKFSDGIPISGRLIKVNKLTRNEFTASKNTNYYKGYNRTIYKDKLKSANNLDEILLATTNYINEDLKHQRKDKFKEFARGDVLIQVGNNKYSAKVIVGFTTGNQRLYLHDVVIEKEIGFSSSEHLTHVQGHLRNTNLSMTSILKRALNVNTASRIIFNDDTRYSIPDRLPNGEFDKSGNFHGIDDSGNEINLTAKEVQQYLKAHPYEAIHDKRQIERKSNQILKAYGSLADKVEVAKELDDIYYRKKVGKEYQNKIKELAEKIYDYIVEDIDADSKEAYDEIRQAMPTIYWNERMKSQFRKSEWNEFIRKYRVKLNLVKEGNDSGAINPIDAYYLLAEDFPQYFDSEISLDYYTALTEIANRLYKLETHYETFVTDHRDQILKEISNDIYRGYDDIDFLYKKAKIGKQRTAEEEMKEYRYQEEYSDESGFDEKRYREEIKST